ncbi:transcriptional repressor [Reichenbachiella agarivorans]|uniref:Transcriptional repressor n=1 Tax=Reichenbachiella agarivorans TaxID=2979464 RepID=A0ABY6CLS8_9BACT|nr:transcriptional repressor [Reichenbachiella agarivorans]UXP31464.1 transcriptional repressor [Reichenbachiella agarivorans]
MLKYSDLKQLLKKHQLRVTDCRLDVLSLFQASEHALTSRFLEHELTAYDRVTLYRTLNSFIESGLLHKIPDDSGMARYGVCDHHCDSEEHRHDHLHFKCDACGHVDCLSSYHVPKVQIPGFLIKEANMILNGLCQSCNS